MIISKQLVAISLVAAMGGAAVAAELGNISTRGKVETGDDRMIAGFVIEGSDAMKVSIMALGSTLSGFGISNPLADPKMTIKNAAGVTIAENDDWNNNAEVIATGETPTDSRESATVLTLNPGAYTVIVEGVNGSTGTAIVAVNKLAVAATPVDKVDDAAKLTGSWFGTASYSINKQICQWQVNMTFNGDGNGEVLGFLLSDEIVRYTVECLSTDNDPENEPDVTYIDFTYQATDGTVSFRGAGGGLTLFPQPKGELNFSDDGTELAITQTIDSNGLLIEYNFNMTKI